jgi:hypothetical protein
MLILESHDAGAPLKRCILPSSETEAEQKLHTQENINWFGLVIALRPQTLKHIRGSWSHYTDTSEPVDGNGAQNMVTVLLLLLRSPCTQEEMRM